MAATYALANTCRCGVKLSGSRVMALPMSCSTSLGTPAEGHTQEKDAQELAAGTFFN